jgi:hypothetical protein
MKEFHLFFRMEKDLKPEPDQLALYLEQWQSWIDAIAIENKLLGGNHLSSEATVLHSGSAIPQALPDNELMLAGYIRILAANMEDACRIAADCPILKGNNTRVEVRETASPG